MALLCEIEPMSENIENLIFETLKKIQAELAASRERDAEILSRLSRIELAVARVARDEGQNYAELIEDRHTIDKLKERIERIERRLELLPEGRSGQVHPGLASPRRVRRVSGLKLRRIKH
jgi:septal ring factor EnvC (AmiA/AmiB activator)